MPEEVALAQNHTPGTPLSASSRYLVLVAAFLGWMFAGVQMSITPLVNRSAVVGLMWPEQSTQNLSSTQDNLVARWFAWNNAGFLLGAATGGLIFGWLGDIFGRTKAERASKSERI